MSLASSTLNKRTASKEEREKAERYLEKKTWFNAKTRLRMQKLRKKKKEEKNAKGRFTRSEQVKHKQHLQADAKRQQERRKAMSKEEQDLVLAKRRAKYDAQKNAERELSISK